jgi:hypothetical protein
LTPWHLSTTNMAPLLFPNVLFGASHYLKIKIAFTISKYMIYNIFNYNVSMSLTYLLMPLTSFDIVSNAMNVLWCPCCPKIFFKIQHGVVNVSNVPFQCSHCCLLQLNYCLLTLYIYLFIYSFIHFLSCHSWCKFNVFLLLPN